MILINKKEQQQLVANQQSIEQDNKVLKDWFNGGRNLVIKKMRKSTR